MFRLLKFLIWTACAMGLGAWLATGPWADKVAQGSEPVVRLWKKSGLPEKIEDAKDALSTVKDHQPRERHSDVDRDAVNKLIAKRGPTK